ncbi:DNA repair protein RecN [hydrothermal vent metagenome]|uniref:DNA repair protein RecN n=1 Tax=hydrothermal vent metagenome TaxID=652676 RepID=A0A3B0S0U6_9ZZZZ
MLNSLTINNIILIDRLHIDFEDGLCVLSGETGAGKSILMDSLGLAIGGRSGRDLVRRGTEQASVSADFHLPRQHNIWTYLNNQGLSHEGGQITLRRTLNRDGRSRAYINDQPVSIGMLRSVGDMLVEIHGQHDERGLLNSGGHRKILDDYGQYAPLSGQLRKHYERLTELQQQLAREEEKLALAQADEDYIRHNLRELEQLAPKRGEENQLADERSRMMQGEQMSEGLGDILSGLLDKNGVDAALRSLIRRLSRMGGQDGGILDPVVMSLDRAANETTEAIVALEDILRNLEFSPHDLENTEERLFALRAAARKHNCLVDDLPDILADFKRKLNALEFGDAEVRRLSGEVIAAREIFHATVARLSKARNKAAKELDDLVNGELAPLKMEKAAFRTELRPLDPSDWRAEGGERVEFQISTNPGAPFGGLIKVASGGELSRFILALKVVLARKTTAPTLVFDEIDRGVGGAVADAVGERLRRLADEAQILVITHSPQVAARGANHWLIEKAEKLAGGDVFTDVISLDDDARQEEIARMLAGARITDEARAAAQSLIEG